MRPGLQPQDCPVVSAKGWFCPQPGPFPAHRGNACETDNRPSWPRTTKLPKALRSGLGVGVSISQTEAQRGEPDLSGMHSRESATQNSGLGSLKSLPMEDLGGFPGRSRLSHSNGGDGDGDNESSLY